MRAAVATCYGPPEVVEVREVPRPAPLSDELLVRVEAATVNRTDCGFRAGHPWFIRGFSGVTRPKRTVLGNEFAGVVAGVGAAVDRFAVGDRVFGYNDTRFGAHAENLTIGQDAPVATMPADRDFSSMAAATEGSHYALAYIRAAGVNDSSDVLVYGATGVIDRTATDFTADDHRYDLVMDAVGKCSFRQCRHLLKPHGVWTSTDLGPLSQNPLLAAATRMSRGRRVLFPFPRIDQEMVEYLKRLIESGRFTPVVDRSYPLERIVEAYRYVETQKLGNVVITIGHGDDRQR